MLDSVTSSLPMRSSWSNALIWAGIAACVAGFAFHRMWLVLPIGRFAESLLLAGLMASAAWPLRRWRGWRWADALALVGLAALIIFTGPLAALAVLALATAAIAIGGMISGVTHPLFALLSGLAAIAGIVGWLLPLPVHHWWIYAPLLLLVIVWRRVALRESARTMVAAWREAVDATPRAAAWAVIIVGLASTGAWLPTMQHDDLAYHLGLPWQLMLHKKYTLDPTHQVWTLAPWAGDVLQAIPQVLARAEARSAMNIMWLLATLAGLWQLATALGAKPAMRWAAIAVYASLPLTTALQGGMQTETPATAVTIGLAALIMSNVPRKLVIGALLFGLLFALKPLHGLVALPLMLWAAWRHRTDINWPWLLPVLTIAFVVAGSSYTYSWAITGNPVLPLLNGIFRSPYFHAVNFDDLRWHGGFDIDLLWDLTFDTEHYMESWDGGIGFVLIALAGAWLLALLDVRSRALTLCASLAVLLPMLALQYARYAHPGMALLIPPLIVALQRLPARPAVWLIAGLCVANLAFQTNAQWMLHVGSVKRTVGTLGWDQKIFAQYAPERVLVAAIRDAESSPGLVLEMDPGVPSYAELAGAGRNVTWYDPKLQAARVTADSDPTGAAWVALLRREGISEVLLRPSTLQPAQRAGLHRIGAQRQLAIGDAEWWRIPSEAAQ